MNFKVNFEGKRDEYRVTKSDARSGKMPFNVRNEKKKKTQCKCTKHPNDV